MVYAEFSTELVIVDRPTNYDSSSARACVRVNALSDTRRILTFRMEHGTQGIHLVERRTKNKKKIIIYEWKEWVFAQGRLIAVQLFYAVVLSVMVNKYPRRFI